jgi:hypothetical protein
MNNQNRCKYFLCNVWWTWFSFTFRYVDDVFLLINSKFGDNVDRILFFNNIQLFPSGKVNIHSYQIEKQLFLILDAVRNPDRNHKLWNQLRTNTLYAGTAGILLHTQE